MAVQDGYGKSSGSESLVFAYDLKDTVNSFRGEPTTNLVATIASYYGGNVSTSYANGQYQTSAIVINGVDNTVPSGNFSQVSGTTTDTNSQTYWTIQGNAVVNESNQTVSFSVYLKGNGTCHLATYNDQCCYQVGPDITLTSTWTRYSITKSLTTFADYHWVAVRGITTSTNVFISSAQWERNSHSTPFTPSSRSNTQGLLDLTGNRTLNISNVSFDSNAQMTFDGTSDYVEVPFETILNDCSFEILFRATSTKTYQYPIALRNPNQGSSYSFYFDMNDPDGSGFAQTMWSYWNSGGSPYSVIPKTGTYGDWNDSTWRHYVFTRSTTNSPYTFHYMNGNLVPNINRSGDQTIQFGNGSGYNLYIGSYASNFGYFVGDLPLIKIYNRVLSPTEITNNYLKYKRQYGLT
jgi:hypothetical protein